MQLVEANLIDPMTPTNWCCVHPYDLLNTLPWWLTFSDAEWTALMNVDAWQGAGEDWPDAYRQ